MKISAILEVFFVIAGWKQMFVLLKRYFVTMFVISKLNVSLEAFVAFSIVFVRIPQRVYSALVLTLNVKKFYFNFNPETSAVFARIF